MPNTEQITQALKESIEHWKNNLDILSEFDRRYYEERWLDEHGFYDNCPLCQLIKPRSTSCKECPLDDDPAHNLGCANEWQGIMRGARDERTYKYMCVAVNELLQRMESELAKLERDHGHEAVNNLDNCDIGGLK